MRGRHRPSIAGKPCRRRITRDFAGVCLLEHRAPILLSLFPRPRHTVPHPRPGKDEKKSFSPFAEFFGPISLGEDNSQVTSVNLPLYPVRYFLVGQAQTCVHHKLVQEVVLGGGKRPRRVRPPPSIKPSFSANPHTEGSSYSGAFHLRIRHEYQLRHHHLPGIAANPLLVFGLGPLPVPSYNS